MTPPSWNRFKEIIPLITGVVLPLIIIMISINQIIKLSSPINEKNINLFFSQLKNDPVVIELNKEIYNENTISSPELENIYKSLPQLNKYLNNTNQSNIFLDPKLPEQEKNNLIRLHLIEVKNFYITSKLIDTIMKPQKPLILQLSAWFWVSMIWLMTIFLNRLAHRASDKLIDYFIPRNNN